MLGEEPVSVRCTFDPSGSYAPTYKALAVDLAIAAGFLGWPLEDERFCRSLLEAGVWAWTSASTSLPWKRRIIPTRSRSKPSDAGSRPSSFGRSLSAEESSKSLSPGVARLDDRKIARISFRGRRGRRARGEKFVAALRTIGQGCAAASRNGRILIHLRTSDEIPEERLGSFRREVGGLRVYRSRPLFFVQRGEALFRSGGEMLDLAEKDGTRLGEIGLLYESRLLGLSRQEALQEMDRLFGIMKTSVDLGLSDANSRMLLLPPFAGESSKPRSAGGSPWAAFTPGPPPGRWPRCTCATARASSAPLLRGGRQASFPASSRRSPRRGRSGPTGYLWPCLPPPPSG